MDRAQAAHGRSNGRSCGSNRSAARSVLDDAGMLGDFCTDAAGTGQVLPAPPCSVAPSGNEEDLQEIGRGLDLWDLWYRLPKEEQIRFGGCFSRMILKILKRCTGSNQEKAS